MGLMNIDNASLPAERQLSATEKPVGTSQPAHLLTTPDYPADTSQARTTHASGMNSEFGKGQQHLGNAPVPGSPGTASSMSSNQIAPTTSHYDNPVKG